MCLQGKMLFPGTRYAKGDRRIKNQSAHLAFAGFAGAGAKKFARFFCPPFAPPAFAPLAGGDALADALASCLGFGELADVGS